LEVPKLRGLGVSSITLSRLSIRMYCSCCQTYLEPPLGPLCQEGRVKCIEFPLNFALAELEPCWLKFVFAKFPAHASERTIVTLYRVRLTIDKSIAFKFPAIPPAIVGRESAPVGEINHVLLELRIE